MVSPKNNYELLSTNFDAFKAFVASGVIPCSVANWLDIYTHFLKESKLHKKTKAVQNTADFWQVSDRNLHRIIKFFETPIVTN